MGIQPKRPYYATIVFPSGSGGGTQNSMQQLPKTCFARLAVTLPRGQLSKACLVSESR